MAERLSEPATALSASEHSAPVRTRRLRRYRAERQWIAYLFLSPWLIGMIGITIGPMLFSLYVAFTNYNMLSAPKWTGLTNFRELFQDPQFVQAVSVTTRFVVISVPLVLLFSLGLAIFLNKGIRFLRIYRTLFYLPSLMGTSAAIAILWLKVFGEPGLVLDFLKLFGLHPTSFIANPATAMYTIVVLNLWAFGATMIIFLAGLRQIPSEYYEAAAIDGAGRLRIFRSVTLPLLTPLIFFNLLLDTVMAFQTFTSAYVIGGGIGQPAGSTMFYTVYIYIQGFTNFRMGYAAAMAWLMLAALGVFAGLCFFSARYWVHYGDER
jgi:multiple sugar transport system permease protein